MMSLSDDKQADIIDAFTTTSRYLDNILNIYNDYFENMESQIYPSELQLIKAYTSDTEAAFLDVHLPIYNDIVSTNFMINVTILILKLSTSHFQMVMFFGLYPMVTLSLNSFVLFARSSSHVADFNNYNKLLTQKLLKQGYRYHKLRKSFSKIYRRYYDLVFNFQMDSNLSCAKGCLNLNSMVTWCIN